MAKPSDSGRENKAEDAPPVVGRTMWDAVSEIGVQGVKGIVSLGFKLIDKGHISTFLALGIIVLLGILAFRIPSGDIQKIPGLIWQAVGPIVWASLAASVVGNVAQAARSKHHKRVYLVEIDRMAEQKKTLEEIIDTRRESSTVRQIEVSTDESTAGRQGKGDDDENPKKSEEEKK